MCRRTSYSRMAIGFKSALVLGLIVFCPMPAVCQRDRTIEGQVRTTDGGPLPSDVSVRLERAEGVEAVQKFVGTDGKFEFVDLTDNAYRLVVTAKDFQTVTQDVDMHFLASRFPTIYLVPVKKKKAPPPPSTTPAATDLAAPRKVRKEYEQGARALEKGNLAEAETHLGKAVAEDPCYARAWTTLGVVHSMQNKLVPAEAAFNKSIKCDGAYLGGYLQLAILLNAQGRYAESEAVLQQGMRRLPSDWRLYYQLGIAHGGSGDYEKAEEELLKAQSMNKDVPSEFHLRLAYVFLNRKEYSKAYTEMQTYLAGSPDSQFAEKIREIMRQMEDSGVVSSSASKTEPPKP